MIRMPVRCPRCHTGYVIRVSKTEVYICNMTLLVIRKVPTIVPRICRYCRPRSTESLA
jgi:hypothetical protein